MNRQQKIKLLKAIRYGTASIDDLADKELIQIPLGDAKSLYLINGRQAEEPEFNRIRDMLLQEEGYKFKVLEPVESGVDPLYPEWNGLFAFILSKQDHPQYVTIKNNCLYYEPKR